MLAPTSKPYHRSDKPPAAPKSDLFLRFILEEAVPKVRERYRCSQQKMLAGHSRAGLFALYAHLVEPDEFTAYFCFSPALWRNDYAIVERAEEAWKKAQTSSAFLYLSVGTDENEKLQRGYSTMAELLDQNLVPGLTVLHETTRGADHGSNTYLSAPSALRAWAEYASGAEQRTEAGSESATAR